MYLSSLHMVCNGRCERMALVNAIVLNWKDPPTGKLELVAYVLLRLAMHWDLSDYESWGYGGWNHTDAAVRRCRTLTPRERRSCVTLQTLQNETEFLAVILYTC